MKNIPKNFRVLLGGVLAIIVIFFVVRTITKPKALIQQPVTESPAENQPSLNTRVNSDQKTTLTNNVFNQLPYGEAVKRFKDYRIQFDQNCQSIPVSQTIKVGTSIMLDNRSANLASIRIDSIEYSIPSYSYRVVSFSYAGSFLVDCNNRQNVSTLIVQK